MTSFPLILLVLVSSAQAFLSAVIPRQQQSKSFLSKFQAKDTEQEDANINEGSSSLKLNAADVTARDVVVACMDGLLNNDTPWANAGLELCWDYSSDRNRAAQGGSFAAFITYASNPTFSTMVDAKEYSIENVGNYIPGTKTRGAMQTILIKVQPLNGEERSFLW